MNIYDNDGRLDLERAGAELKRTDGMAVDRRRAAVAELTTAALLDIAESLRPIALEASLALRGYLEQTEPAEAEPVTDEDDFFVIGDLVTADGYDEPGEIIGFGYTEGERTATVRFMSGAESRVWMRALVRLRGDEGDGSGDEPDPADAAAVEAEARIVDEGETPDDEEIEDDFVDPAAALEALKAKKKASSKKGKKS